jgi:hypothetical protein
MLLLVIVKMDTMIPVLKLVTNVLLNVEDVNLPPITVSNVTQDSKTNSQDVHVHQEPPWLMDLAILVLTNVPNVKEVPLIVPNVLILPEDQPTFVHVLMDIMMMVTLVFVILVTEFV